MKHQLLFFHFILLFVFSSAQSFRIDTIKATGPESPYRKYIFPSVKMAKNKNIADKINRGLALDFLQIDPRKARKSIFENVWSTPKRATILSDIEFKTTTNKRVLSIELAAEGCGAYCEEFTNYYNYDLQTGELIQIASLFTQQGLQSILDSLSAFRKKILTDMVRQIKDSIAVRRTDEGYNKNMLELYVDCLEERTSVDPQFVSFTITTKKIIFTLDRCSAHVDRNLDELGEFKIPFLIKNLELLSEYGKKVLLR